MKTDETVIFMHIPKTAGTTFENIIRKNYKKNDIYEIWPHKGAVPEDLKKLSCAEKRKIKVVFGHFHFGIHKYLPRRCTYITFVRDPVERVISHYYYVLREPKHYLYNQVVSRNMSLKDYVSSGISKEMDNGQVRQLGGSKLSFVSKEHLEDAKNNIENCFSIVGFTERFDETLILLKKRFGWKINYIRKNVTKNRPKKEQIDKATQEIIRRNNKLDLKLYDVVKKKFDKVISQIDGFKKEVIFFKFIMAGYEKMNAFKEFVKTLIR